MSNVNIEYILHAASVLTIFETRSTKRIIFFLIFFVTFPAPFHLQLNILHGRDVGWPSA